MRLTLVSYNTENINDGTNYNAFFDGAMEVQGGSRIIELSRAGRRPVYATKVLQGKIIKLHIYMLGDIADQIDELNTIFDVEEMDPKVLIAEDESETQWYINAVTKSVPKVQGRILTVELSASDPAWRTVVEEQEVWSITGSGDEEEVTIAGNLPAYPVYSFKPTAAGGNRFAYRRLAIFYNRATAALNNYPLMLLSSWDTSALVSDATNHVHINAVGGIDDDDDTIPYDDETGTFPTSGLAYLGTEQIYYTGKTATDLTGVVRGVNGTTAAAHADDVQINQSHIQADGDDIRVYVNGEEVDRWLDSMNAADTKLWINISYSARQLLNIASAMTDGAITTITFSDTVNNNNALKKLPTKGEVYIDSELFGYTGKNLRTRQLTGVSRAIKGTVAAAHSANAYVKWVQHEIYIYYGNVDLEAPDTDDTYKPCLELGDSTNSSWVYDEFGGIENNRRSARFAQSLVSTLNRNDDTNKSGPYTGSQFEDADPFTDMGMMIKAWQSGSTWKAENATVLWRLSNPCYITHVTATGEKYRHYTGFPTARCQKSKDNTTWLTVWTDASPGSAQSWTALAAHSAVALGDGYRHIRFIFFGPLGATASNSAGYSIDGLTLTLNSSYVPTGTVLAQESIYYLNATLYNDTTGESIRVYASMELNDTLEVDTLNKTVRLVADDKPVNTLKLSTVRRDWLKLIPGANDLRFVDVGTGTLTLTIDYEGRNT